MTHDEILDRLRKATGPSFDIDRDLGLLIDGWARFDECNYTESIDAALALVERMLPDWQWTLSNVGRDNGVYQTGKAGAYLTPPISSGWTINGFGATAPLSILLALFEALKRNAAP